MTDRTDNPVIDTGFELAANPLNSVNPPPRDLPDLLDTLLNSESSLNNCVTYCNNLARELDSRLQDLESRLENLRQKFPQWRSDNPEMVQGPRDKHRLAFEAQEIIYRRMVAQITFLHNLASLRTPISLLRQRTECKHIFDAFLGARHNHQGIEIANSAHLHCINGCRWYFEHGPYEWTKKPYSNEWWTEMNHTDWDWVKLRTHIQNLFEENNNQIRELTQFQRNIGNFIPSWFWKGSTHRWGLQTKFNLVEHEDRVKRLHYRVFVSYQRTEPEIEQQREHIRAAIETKRELEGKEDAHGVDASKTEIEPMGVYEFNNNEVFDGEERVADWDLATMVLKGSWLARLGYDEWTEKRCF